MLLNIYKNNERMRIHRAKESVEEILKGVQRRKNNLLQGTQRVCVSVDGQSVDEEKNLGSMTEI